MVVGWLVTGTLGVVALCRIFAWDAISPLALLNAFTLYLYLPAWIVAIGALIGRRWWLALASLAVVAAQVLFVAPELEAATPAPAWAAHAPTLRLLDANVSATNPSMAGYAGQIREDHPDLVTFEEAGGVDAAQLARDGAWASLSYRYVVNRSDPWGFVVASRYPIERASIVSLYGRPLVVQLRLGLPSGPLDVWVVHTTAPVPGSAGQWKGQLGLVTQLVQTEHPAPLLMVGDFNATWNARGFRSLLDKGLADGAAARGDAWSMTWSQSFPVLPPLVRIDHVLTGAGVATTRIATEPGEGSDHRELLATVAIDRPRVTGAGRGPSHALSGLGVRDGSRR